MNRKWLIFWIIFFWCGFFILMTIPESSLTDSLKLILLGSWGTLVSLFTLLLVSLSYKHKLEETLAQKELELEQERLKFTSNATEAETSILEPKKETESIPEEVPAKTAEPVFPVEPWNAFLRKILKNRPFEETITSYQQFLQEMFPDSSGVLYMYNGNESEMGIIFNYGEILPTENIIRPSACASFTQGDLIIHDFANPENSCGCTHLENHSNGVSFCVPIEGLDEHFGLLSVYVPNPTAEEVNFLKLYLKLSSSLLGLFSANQHLNILFEKHNIRDMSTGLFNARHMEESLNREIASARRHKQPIGIIMIYPDSFEFFQGTYGQKVSDQLLWEIGQRLPRYIRTEDIPCRYKDDLFCIILPGADFSITKERAEKIRKEIDGLEIVYGDLILKSTLSIGVSVFPQFAHDANELLDNAFIALQEAFHNGKNQVITSADIRS